MAEGAFVNRFGSLPKAVSNKLRAMSAATDNVGLFFGEDIFVAFGSIVLMQTFMKTTANLDVDPLHIAVWGIPTAICAFLIHATRLYRLDSQLQRMASTVPVATPNTLLTVFNALLTSSKKTAWADVAATAAARANSCFFMVA